MTKNTSLAIVALTRKACALARYVKDLAPDREVDLFLSEKWAKNDEEGFASFKDTAERVFDGYEDILFIMATGIVVRSIAGLLESKSTDPAVLVMDEGANHVISLVSGHLGGANKLAVEIGKWTGASPVITTASDVSGKHAVDMLAVKYGLVLKDMEMAKRITSLFVDGEDVKVVDPLGYLREEAFPQSIRPKGALLVSHQATPTIPMPCAQLIPKDLVLGMGCRKGIPYDKVKEAMEETFLENNLAMEALSSLATVDIKGEEPAFLLVRDRLKIPMHIFSSEQIDETKTLFVQSDFVKKTLGTGAVAEPCGYLGSNKGDLLVGKTIKDGVTLSIWRMNTNV